MKKVLLLLLTLILASSLALAEEGTGQCGEEDRINGLEVRYDYAFARAEERRVQMEAVVDVLGDVATEELTTLIDDFQGLYDDAEAAAEDNDPRAFGDTISEGQHIINDFRTLARELAVGANISHDEVRAAIKEAVDDSAEELEENIEKARDHERKMREQAVNMRTCRTEQFLDRMSDRGVDTTELESDLEEIKAALDELNDLVEAAIESCGRTPLRQCDDAEGIHELREEINDLLRDLRRATAGEMAEAREDRREEREDRRGPRGGSDDDMDDVEDAQEEIDDAVEEIEKAAEKIDEREADGKNVTEARALLSEAEETLARAIEAFDAMDYETAEELAEQAEDLANEAREGEYASDDDEDDIEDDDDVEEEEEDDDDVEEEEEDDDDDDSMNETESDQE